MEALSEDEEPQTPIEEFLKPLGLVQHRQTMRQLGFDNPATDFKAQTPDDAQAEVVTAQAEAATAQAAAVRATAPPVIGMRVLGLFDSTWDLGTIMKVHENSEFNVSYDDGTQEIDVKWGRDLRPAPP